MKNSNINNSRKVLLLFLVLKSFFLFSQNDKFNLSFDKFENNKITYWNIDTLLIAKKDSIVKKEGKYALRLENKTSRKNKIINNSNIISYTYDGKKLKFEGYIKTKNLSEGSVYLFVVIGNKTQQFYHGMTQQYTGTQDWQKFEIDIPYTREATYISLNCNFHSTGTIWLDNFKVLIDDININQLSPINVFDNNTKSNFTINQKLSFEDIKKLAMIGKVWGYLKYYHPSIISGKYNWDKELFKILPIYKSENFEKELEKWVISLSDIKYKKSHKPKFYYKQTTNFSWFNNSLIRKKLRRELKKTYKAKRDSVHSFYVKINDGVSIFKNELSYSNMDYKDDGMKLLALFRYWNMVEYFFPFKHLTSQNWDEILVQEIPKILKSQDRLSYILTLQEFVVRTEDTHSMILTNAELIHFFGEKKPPITVKSIENSIVINSILSANSGLKLGDEIIQINNVPIKTIKDKIYKYSIASNQITSDRNFARNCIRTNDDTITLKIKRDTSYLNIIVPTQSIHQLPKSKLPKKIISNITNKIGYFHIHYANENRIDSIFNIWNNKKGIIMDFRGSSDGLSDLTCIASYLYEQKQIMDTYNYTNLSYPGVFKSNKQIFHSFLKPVYKGKLIILIDENSQSAYEYIPMFLSYLDNVHIIGSQSSGAGASAASLFLPGNIEVNMARRGFYTKNGEQIQKTGIVPDIYINENVKSIRMGRDLALEKAVKYILQ
jgi:C-terminal processing protease CtpA/Prc